MHKFVRSLITEWRRLKLPFDGATVIAAVSGGADSVSLLLAIHDLITRNKLEITVIVAHFDHRLRGEDSKADAAFVRDLAEGLGFEFVVGRGKLPKVGNLEENARDSRYRFLEKAAKKHNARLVLTGHTINDQAETVLFNLIRGSGPEGLAGMRSIRPLTERRNAEIRLVRPLLSWATRKDTETFCRYSSIDFREDAMNDDPAFSRVRIRKELIPLLETYNPKIVQTLARTSTLIGRPVLTDPPETLKLTELNKLDQSERFGVLRTWLASRRGDLRSISLKHIEAIDRLVNSRKSGRVVELPSAGCVVKRSGMLVFERIKVD